MDGEAFPPAPVYAAAFERTLDRLLSDLDADFIGGSRRRAVLDTVVDDPEGALRRLREAVARGAPGLEASGAADLDELAAFLGRAGGLMRAFAREHRQAEVPLL
jgi:hypothetical protein